MSIILHQNKPLYIHTPSVASIYDQAESFKRDLLTRDRDAASRLTDAYVRAWTAIKKQLDALTKQILS